MGFDLTLKTSVPDLRASAAQDDPNSFRWTNRGMLMCTHFMEIAGMLSYTELAEVGGALDFHGDQPGIEYLKLGTNDDWHVTAQECREALQAWSRFPEEAVKDAPEWWPPWVAWLELAAEQDGFIVS